MKIILIFIFKRVKGAKLSKAKRVAEVLMGGITLKYTMKGMLYYVCPLCDLEQLVRFMITRGRGEPLVTPPEEVECVYCHKIFKIISVAKIGEVEVIRE